jgi:uncharacterized protein (TIGR02145 family)
MKTILFFLLPVVSAAGLYSQQYEITFAGTGAADVVDSIVVENLNQGISLTINGNDILQLNLPTGMYRDATDNNLLQVYPNPMTDRAEILIPVQESGNISATVYDGSGKTVAQSILFLQPGMHKYCITGLNQGIYMIRIQEQRSFCSAKLVSQSRCYGEAEIAYVSSLILPFCQAQKEIKQVKSAASTIEMPYNAGDRLKLTGMSGTFSRVLTAVPSADETITFNFIECMDADSNHYPVVTIGSQTWMAENLKTTHYFDGNPIPKITSENNWSALSSTDPAYCWYNNDSTTCAQTYGALYTWSAAMNSAPSSTANPSGVQGACPTGWHLPSDTEWKVLTDFLGGMSVAGGKLKETGTTHWTGPNTGATNESGFTALPGGGREHKGSFIYFSEYSAWWCATECNTDNSWGRGVYNLDKTVYRLENGGSKGNGISVRCVKD